ncbi:hypothetical protein GF312_15370 [Candidatus Poribacteria bacterium]|nr:hypothetical protein [Candidatus Poribacteria bacterium]
MRFAFLYLTLLLLVLSNFTASAQVFERGENRLRNSDFESDIVGEEPIEWATQKGG